MRLTILLLIINYLIMSSEVSNIIPNNMSSDVSGNVSNDASNDASKDINIKTTNYLNLTDSTREFICHDIYSKFGYTEEIQAVINEQYDIFEKMIQEAVQWFTTCEITDDQEYVTVIIEHKERLLNKITNICEYGEMKEANHLHNRRHFGVHIHINNNDNGDDDNDDDDADNNVTEIESKVKTTKLTNIKFSDFEREVNKKQCTICMEEYKPTDDLAIISCGHVFHASCIEKWEKKICPYCRH